MEEYVKLPSGGYYRKGHYAIYDDNCEYCVADCYHLSKTVSEEKMIEIACCIYAAYKEGRHKGKTEIKERFDKFFI